MGRLAGGWNKDNSKAKEAFSLLVEGNLSKMQEWLDQIALESPKDAYKLILDTAEFCIPKQARVQAETTVRFYQPNEHDLEILKQAGISFDGRGCRVIDVDSEEVTVEDADA